VADEQRHLDGLAIRQHALAAHPVDAKHLAVVGGEDDNRVFGLATGVEQADDLLVTLADAVVIVVDELVAGRRVLIGELAEREVRTQQVFARRRHPASLRRGTEVRRRRVAELLPVERRLRWPGQLVGIGDSPTGRHRRPGREVHDVVRVDDVDGREPGPTAAGLAVQERDSLVTCLGVVLMPPERAVVLVVRARLVEAVGMFSQTPLFCECWPE